MCNIKAIIFDMDGVIVNSQAIWYNMEEDIFSQILPSASREKIHEVVRFMTGMSVKDEYHYLKNKENCQLSFEEFLAIYDEKATEVYTKQARLSPGLMSFLNKKQPYIYAIASSGSENWIRLVLERFDLKRFFSAVVSAEHLAAPSKPDPAIFLFTAQKINVSPQNCLVIEDAEHGVQAAKKANMYCVGFQAAGQEQDLSLADAVISTFDELEETIEHLT